MLKFKEIRNKLLIFLVGIIFLPALIPVPAGANHHGLGLDTGISVVTSPDNSNATVSMTRQQSAPSCGDSFDLARNGNKWQWQNDQQGIPCTSDPNGTFCDNGGDQTHVFTIHVKLPGGGQDVAQQQIMLCGGTLKLFPQGTQQDDEAPVSLTIPNQQQTGSVSGTLQISYTDTSGKKVAGCQGSHSSITLNGPTKASVQLDEQGVFSKSGLKPGLYTMAGTCVFIDSNQNSHTSPVSIKNIAVNAGKNTDLGIVVVNVQGGPPGDNGGGGTKISCDAGAGFTWIICGAINLMQGLIDWIVNEIIIPFVQTKPLETSGPIFEGWKNLRTVADVLLVPIFFILIFAQSLSLNIDAYTIKKMLPRLVAAVILIQFSYYIAAILVDVTNVLGNGIGNLLTNTFAVKGAGGKDFININFTGINPFLGGITITALIITGIGAAATGALFTLMIPLLLSFIGVLFTLIFRQLLIVMLVILAPVAFVLWVLPNTSKFFKMWWDFLLKALLMYPLIVILLASGTIVASILTTDLPSGGTGSGVVKEIGALAAIILPLALIPFTFKFAGAGLAAAAGAVQKLRTQSMYNKKGDARGWLSRMQQGTGNRRADMQAGNRGRVFKAITNPGAVLPGSMPGPTGRRIPIPLIGTLGVRSRARALDNFRTRKNQAMETLDKAGINSPDLLRGLVHAGRSEREFRSYIATVRESNPVAARQLETLQPYVGQQAVSAAAAVRLGKTGTFEQGDVDVLTDAMHSNPAGLQSTLDDVGFEMGQNGAVGFAAFQVAANSNGTSVRGVALNSGRIKDRVYKMDLEGLKKEKSFVGDARTPAGVVQRLLEESVRDEMAAAQAANPGMTPDQVADASFTVQNLRWLMSPLAGTSAQKKQEAKQLLSNLGVAATIPTAPPTGP